MHNSNLLYEFIHQYTSGQDKYYVTIDEIQYVDGFEDLLNSLKNKGCDVYITGSNSKMLSADISTALRGQSIEIRMQTLSFSEFYSYVRGDKNEVFNTYLLYGGFPYFATEKNSEFKVRYVNMLHDTVETKDIIERYGIRNPDIFNAVYNFLCSNIGSSISAKKISDSLRSNGYKTITPDIIGNYLTWFCESFLFSKVYRYDIKENEYLKHRINIMLRI